MNGYPISGGSLICATCRNPHGSEVLHDAPVIVSHPCPGSGASPLTADDPRSRDQAAVALATLLNMVEDGEGGDMFGRRANAALVHKQFAASVPWLALHVQRSDGGWRAVT